MRCRFCGSTALHNDTQHKNFSTGKAVAGAVMIGTVGAAAGFIGKDVAGWRCGACGQFMAEPMDVFLEMQIDNAVRDAEAGKDPSMLRYYQGQFPHIQAQLPPAAPITQHAPVERPVPSPAEQQEAAEAASVKRCYEPGVWQPDCPVFVEAVTLRTKGGEDHLSLYAANLSEKAIRTVYFQAVVYDDTGDEVTRKQCVYQNLSVSGGDAGPAQKQLPEDRTFPLGTDLAYRVEMHCEKVAFADDTVWRAPDAPETVTLPAQPVLTGETFPRFRYLQTRWHGDGSKLPVRMPLEEETFWLCDCGHPAKKNAPCSFCGDTLPALQEAFSQKTLEARQRAAVKERAERRAAFSQKLYRDSLNEKQQKIYDRALELEEKADTADKTREAIAVWEQIPDFSDVEQHLERCRARVPQLEEKEEAERRDAEKRAETEKLLAEAAEAAARKKRNKILAIVGAAAAVFLAAMLVVTKIIIPNGEYNEAVALMDAGKYDEAIAAFEAMNGYKDSETQISEVHYREANALMEDEAYAEAANAYQALGDYKDSADKAAAAGEANNQKNYDAAVALMSDGNYAFAYTKLSSLGDYKDSAERADVCCYHIFLDPYVAGEECALIPLLEALQTLPDDLLETKQYRELFESMLSSVNGTYSNGDYRITIRGNYVEQNLHGPTFSGTVSWRVQNGQFTESTTGALKQGNTYNQIPAITILPTENGLNIIEKNRVIEYVKQGN